MQTEDSEENYIQYNPHKGIMLNKISAHEWLCVALKLQSEPGLNPKKDITHPNKVLQFSVLPHKCQESTSN